jgi:hypothetical protein
MNTKKISLLMATAAVLVSGVGMTGLALADTTKINGRMPSMEAGDFKREPGVMGKVSAISGTTITLTGKSHVGGVVTDVSYTVDASAATVKKFVAGTDESTKPTETTITVSDIAVDDTIMVKGTVTETTVTATEIIVGQPGKGPGERGGKDMSDVKREPGVMGKVSAISGNTVTLSGKSGFGKDATDVSYTVDVSAATVKKFVAGTDGSKPTETTIAVSDIVVGDMIMVKGTVSGTTVTATEIMVGQFGMGGHGEKEGRAGRSDGQFGKNGIGVHGKQLPLPMEKSAKAE